MANKEVIVIPYSNTWALAFRELSEVFSKTLKDYIIGIEHVGSTSVPGLAAKPIIDLDIVIKNKNHFKDIVQVLNDHGYTHLGEMGIIGRDAFKNISDLSPVDGSGNIWPKHHLYVCTEDSIALKNHILFRDHLRSNPEIATIYGELKIRLAKKYPFDIDSYLEDKTEFIISILKKNGFDNETLASIKKQNEKQIVLQKKKRAK